LETQTPILFEDYYAPFERWFENRIYPSKDGLAIFFTEITERKRAEEVLQESERRFREMLENIQLIAVLLDLEGRVTFCNEFLLQITGYTRDEVLGCDWFAQFVPDLRPDVKATFLHGLQRGEMAAHHENPIRTKSGEERYIRFSNTILRDIQGKIIGTTSLGEDITEHKQAEQALRESEERLSKIFRASPIAISVAGMSDGKLTEVNDVWCKLMGFSREEAVGYNVEELKIIDSEHRSRIREEILSKGSLNLLDSEITTKSGEKKSILTSAELITTKGSPFSINLVIDITERKRAEETLRASEEKFRALFIRAERREEERILFDRIGKVIANELDLSRLLRNVVEAVSKTFGYDLVSLYLLRGISLVLQHQVGYAQVISEVSITEGVSGRVVRTGQPVFVQDVRTDPAFLGAMEGITSEICVPLIDEGNVIGILNIESKQAQGLNESDLKLMTSLSEYIYPAIARAQLHTQVAEQEERYRKFIRYAPEPIYMYDAETRIVQNTNPAFLNLLGYTAEEALRLTLYDIVAHDRSDIDRAYQEVLVKGSAILGERKWRHKDGTLIDVFVTVSNVIQAGHNYFFVLAQDITERKRAEEDLRRNQASLERAEATAHLGSWSFDPSTQSGNWSKEMFRLFGRDAVLGVPSVPEFMELIHPDDREQLIAVQARALESGESVLADFRTNPERIPFRVLNGNFYGEKNDEGKVVSVVGTALDITERKQLEEQRTELYDRFTKIAANVPGAIFQYKLKPDGSASVPYASAGICDLYEVSPDEIKDDATPIIKCIHPEDVEWVLKSIQDSAEKLTSWHVENRVILPSGKTIWVEGHSTPQKMEDGTILWHGFQSDITERKRAEETLRESRARLEEAQRIAHVGSWDWIAETDTPTWSKELCAILEVDPDKPVSSMAEQDKLYTPDSMVRMRTSVEKTMQTGEPYEIELERVRADGSRRWLLARGEQWLNEDGQVKGLRGTALDITERKQAEEALRTKTQELDQYFANALDLLCIATTDGKFVRLSREWESVLQFPLEELHGRQFLDFVHAEDVPATLQAMTQLSAQNPVLNFVNRYRRRDGTYRLLEWRSYPHNELIYAVARDITERKQAEGKLRRNEEMLTLFVEHSPAAIAMFDRDLKYIVTSRRYLEDYDLGEQNLVGRSHYDVFPEIPERWKDIHRRCLAGATERNEEDPFPRLSGKLDWIRWKICPWHEANGEIGGIILFSEVITESKRAEAEIQRRLKELEAFYQASLSFSRLQEIEAVGEQVLQYLEQMLEYQRGAIVLHNETSGELELIAHVRMDLDDSKHEQEVERVRGFFELPHGITRWVAEHGEPIRTGDVRSDPRYLEADPAIRSEMAVPLKIGERILGALNVESAQPDAFSEHDERLLTTVANVAAVSIQNARLLKETSLRRDRLVELSRQLVQTQETESRTIGRELHDQIGQMLTALKLTLDIAAQLPAEEAAQKFVTAQELVDDLMSRVSRLSLELRPPMLDDLGLIPALLWHITRHQEQTGIEIDFKHGNVEGKRFDPEIETTAYRIVQESLTNVARHAQATRVRLEVRGGGGMIEIQIEDNGQGFDPDIALAKNRGLGG
ncbi:MAG TPA: PAS domain S-box protein, partial [Anaerolineales bacterium]|nr:PAS domain S-box protein [Anaerolineales bacterium]